MSYQYVPVDENTSVKMQVFRDKFEALHKEIQGTNDPSRGLSLCLTKLEEANFWLNKAITKND